MLILLSTIFSKNSTLNSAVVDIVMCSTSLEGCSLEVTSLKGCSQSFKGGRLFECSIRVFQFFQIFIGRKFKGVS